LEARIEEDIPDMPEKELSFYGSLPSSVPSISINTITPTLQSLQRIKKLLIETPLTTHTINPTIIRTQKLIQSLQ
jgi:hypothetical protein